MVYRAAEKTLTHGSMKMDYITFGTGTKPLVMLQGLNTRGIKGAANALALMYRVFAKSYKVYLFDRREDLSEGVTVRELASDLAVAMDALGISNADVFAVSQGGMIAQYLAIDRPDLVDRMVLAVTAARTNETIKTVVDNWTAMTVRGEWKALVADMAEKMYSDAYLKRYKPFLPLLTLLQKPKDVQRFLILAKACLTCEAYDELDRIQCPVFVIGGRNDQVVGGKASEELAEKLHCPVYLYEDLGHAAYEEAGDFNTRVLAFLQAAE